MTPHPLRRQRRRTKGWRMPEGGVYVGRPSIWGNPTMSAKLFRAWLEGGTGWIWRYFVFWEIPTTREKLEARRREILRRLPELRGKPLYCWCGLDCDCHGDVLAEMANR